MSAHAFLAPSSAHRWVLCPASPGMEAKYPEQGDKPSAVEGTAAHAVMEQLLANRAPPPDATPEMIDGAMLVVDVVRNILAHHPGAWVMVEKPVQIPRVHPQNWGTPDVRIWDEGSQNLWVIDYKFGHGVVEIFENWQLVDYVAGCLTEINAMNSVAGMPATSEVGIMVHMAVIQPRAYHPHGPVRWWEVGATLLRDRIHHLSMAADEATSSTAQCKPHPVACEHCSARHACDALQRAAYRGMDIARAAIGVDLPPAALGLELRMVDEALQLLEARKSGLAQQVEMLMRAGKVVPHWTMIAGQTREKWVKPDAEVIALGVMMGADLAKPPEAITPAQAKAKGVDAAVIAAFSMRPPGAMKLAIDNGAQARRVFE